MLTGEVKARKTGEGFKTLARWLGDNDLLLLRQNHEAPLAVMPWHVFLSLVQAFYDSETQDLPGWKEGDPIMGITLKEKP